MLDFLLRPLPRLLGGPALLVCSLPLVAAPELKVAANARLGYDSNVFLQSVTELADRGSWVAGFGTELAAGWRPGGEARIALTYAPDAVQLLDETEENFVRHRLALTWTRPGAGGPLEVAASLLATDGPNLPSIWAGPGGAPAGGGPAVRGRRDATVHRMRVALPFAAGDWLVRPQAAAYVHDFRSEHLPVAGCQNSVDRSDVHTGVDLGRKVGSARVYGGFRLGAQDQAALLQYPEEYDNRYTRLLGRWEGQWSPRWSGALAVGPEWRRYGSRVPASFGSRERTLLFVDLAASWAATERDALGFAVRQWELPGSSGRATYEDLVLEATWTRRVSERWTAQCGVRAQRFQFRAPIARDDWARCLTLSAQRRLSAALTLGVELVREQGESEIPDLAGRDYTRSFGSVTLRWAR